MRNSNQIIFLCILLISLITLVSPVTADPPNRIISLAPNITEILFALGLNNNIIGVTNFCDYPEQAKKKPKVGGMSNPSLETVVSLKPDIVVMTTDGNPKEFEERLRSLKIRTYVFKARKLAELPQGIMDIGSALGVSVKADALAEEIESAIKKYQALKYKFELKFAERRTTLPPNPPLTRGGVGGVKVLFIIWPEPLIVAGPGTAINDTITLLGRENIASKAKVPYPKYSIEEIIHQAPDIIFIGKGHSDIKEMSQGLLKKIASVPAVKNGDVFFLSDSLYRLGPRIIKGIEEMAVCLR